MARVLTVTVVSSSPLTVSFPGDPSGPPVPAVNTSGLSLAVGDRVQVQVVAPQFPTVTGRVS